MNNKLFIITIPVLILVAVGLTITLDYSNEEQSVFSGSYTRTDQVQPQVLDNGCYPALHLNGTYYEVCYHKELENGT
jgi:hypothetical protein